MQQLGHVKLSFPCWVDMVPAGRQDQKQAAVSKGQNIQVQFQRMSPLTRFRTIFCTCRFTNILSKDELARLSCMDDVESRIVRGGTTVAGGNDEWCVEHGPFEEEFFADIGPRSRWTLLVNEVNRHEPEVRTFVGRESTAGESHTRIVLTRILTRLTMVPEFRFRRVIDDGVHFFVRSRSPYSIAGTQRDYEVPLLMIPNFCAPAPPPR